MVATEVSKSKVSRASEFGIKVVVSREDLRDAINILYSDSRSPVGPREFLFFEITDSTVYISKTNVSVTITVGIKVKSIKQIGIYTGDIMIGEKLSAPAKLILDNIKDKWIAPDIECIFTNQRTEFREHNAY